MKLPLMRRRLWLVVLVLLLAIPLAFLLSRVFGGFVRDVVAVPILYVVWVGRLYLGLVPQAFFWGAFLLFGLALAVTSILIDIGSSGGDSNKGHQQVESDRIRPGQVGQLTSQIKFATRSTYFRRHLAQRLGRLMVRSLGYGDHYGASQVERGLDVLDAPPEIRAFLREGGQLMSPSRPGGLIAWLTRLFRGGEEVAASNPDLEHTVQFLEDRLEG